MSRRKKYPRGYFLGFTVLWNILIVVIFSLFKLVFIQTTISNHGNASKYIYLSITMDKEDNPED